MALATVLFVTGSIVAVAIALTLALCTGLAPFRRSIGDADEKVAEMAPYVAAAGGVFLLKHLTNGLSDSIEQRFAWDVTDSLYAVEGLFVASLQDVVPDVLDGFFSVMYFFGFPYLLLVPLVLYFTMDSLRTLKELVVAYALNTVVGTICYTLFVVYGPRNYVSSHVDGTMYRLYPETQELTAAVADNTDVFPSLHTSMAVVVLLLAWRTRDAYPRWFLLSAFTASTISLSTMTLGIHWLSDVVAGVVLAVWSVLAAQWIVGVVEGTDDVVRSTGDDRSIETDVGD